MTRKDYELIAQVILALREIYSKSSDGFARGYLSATADIAILLSERLVKDNPRFDRERFLKARGVAG